MKENTKNLDKEIKDLEEKFVQANVPVSIVLACEEQLKTAQKELASLKEEKQKLLNKYAEIIGKPPIKISNSEIVDLSNNNFGYLYPKNLKKLNSILLHIDKNLFRIMISIVALIITLAILITTCIGTTLSLIISSISALTFSSLTVVSISKIYLHLNNKNNKMYNDIDLQTLIKQRLDEVNKSIVTKENLCKLYYEDLMPQAISLKAKKEEKERLEREKNKQENNLLVNIESLFKNSDNQENTKEEKTLHKVLK